MKWLQCQLSIEPFVRLAVIAANGKQILMMHTMMPKDIDKSQAMKDTSLMF